MQHKKEFCRKVKQDFRQMDLGLKNNLGTVAASYKK